MIHETTDFDYAELEKGDVLSVGHCEAVLNLSPVHHPKAYPLALMGLVQQVERELQQAGKRYTVATRKGQVVVLTDAEASEYNDHGFECALKKAKRSHFRMQQVNVNNLDQNERARHDNNLVKQAAVLQAVRNARKALHPAPSARTTPTLG